MSEAEDQLRKFIEDAIKEAQKPESLRERIDKMHQRIREDKKVEKSKYGL